MGQFLDKTGLQTVLEHIRDTYAKKPIAISDIAGLQDQLTAGKFQATVVDSLPSEGENGTIYLVAASKTGENNIYAEYIWVTDKFEKLGEASVDLSAYSTTTEMNSAIADAINAIPGRRYIDVAVPSTNPTETNESIFYIAGTAGEYVNFKTGSINTPNVTINEGEIAILTYDKAGTNWNKTTVYTSASDSAIPVADVKATINAVLSDTTQDMSDDNSSEAPRENPLV